jgi:hypothetical protein
MNRHKLTYIDMYPQPVKTEEAPPLWAQVIGGLVAAGALYVSIVFLFTL